MTILFHVNLSSQMREIMWGPYYLYRSEDQEFTLIMEGPNGITKFQNVEEFFYTKSYLVLSYLPVQESENLEEEEEEQNIESHTFNIFHLGSKDPHLQFLYQGTFEGDETMDIHECGEDLFIETLSTTYYRFHGSSLDFFLTRVNILFLPRGYIIGDQGYTWQGYRDFKLEKWFKDLDPEFRDISVIDNIIIAVPEDHMIVFDQYYHELWRGELDHDYRDLRSSGDLLYTDKKIYDKWTGEILFDTKEYLSSVMYVFPRDYYVRIFSTK